LIVCAVPSALALAVATVLTTAPTDISVSGALIGGEVVATGGDAPVIAESMPEIDHIDPDLTLDGLRLAALRNLG